MKQDNGDKLILDVPLFNGPFSITKPDSKGIITKPNLNNISREYARKLGGLSRSEVTMKEFEASEKLNKPATKENPTIHHIPTMEELKSMSAENLVKMIMSPDMAKSMNQPLRQMIILILQQREGNAFVQHLLGKPTGTKPK